LPELTSEKFQAFWKAVKAARVLKGMTLDQAAYACFGRDNAKGYFSQIENGKRQITPRTAGKIITALDMDRALLEPFLGEDEIAEDEVTDADTDAEKLIEKAQADDAGSVTGERLLIDLAYDFAQGQHNDLFTAYKGLRAALQAARELKEQGNLPQNASSQLDAVLRRVSEMNEQGDRNGAAEFLAAEGKRLDAEAEALFNAQLKQDRVRNRPDLAAKRLYRHTTRKAHEAGEQKVPAIAKLTDELSEDGDKNGDMFSLRVALELAKANNDAASGKYAGQTLFELGYCYYRLAARSSETGLLKAAQSAFQASLQKTDKARDPLNWSGRQDGLATTLGEIGSRSRDVAILREAVFAFRQCLEISERHNNSPHRSIAWSNLGVALQWLGQCTTEPVLLKEAVTCRTKAISLTDKAGDSHIWRGLHSNLGLTLRWLGALTEDEEMLHGAREAFAKCESFDFHEKAPMTWAKSQWNIADLALARFVLNPDPALLVEARYHVTRARDFFVEGSEYQTQRCDELIGRIDTIEAAA
jgi:tetratricopeptide (TPR) repeat protein